MVDAGLHLGDSDAMILIHHLLQPVRLGEERHAGYQSIGFPRHMPFRRIRRIKEWLIVLHVIGDAGWIFVFGQGVAYFPDRGVDGCNDHLIPRQNGLKFTMGKWLNPDLALQLGIIRYEGVVVATVARDGDLYPQL